MSCFSAGGTIIWLVTIHREMYIILRFGSLELENFWELTM